MKHSLVLSSMHYAAETLNKTIFRGEETTEQKKQCKNCGNHTNHHQNGGRTMEKTIEHYWGKCMNATKDL